jgi:ribulose-5-phosphate 4-epimerase/fuculose-1-phosphate aldolase
MKTSTAPARAPVTTPTPATELSVRGALAADPPAATPMRQRVSAAEWQTRVDLAACYRLMALHGMADMIYNHITARVPGEPQHLLINPYGLHYSEITATLLHKIDHDGEIVLRAPTRYGINHAGHVIHGAVHAARPDVQCVIHSHTQAGVAVSALACGLLPISLTGMRFHGHIGYHDFCGTVVDLAERESLAADLAGHDALVLRNHGLLTCGPSIAEAFNAHYVLDMACRIQLDAMAAGSALLTPEAPLLARTAELFRPDVRRPYGVLEWEAMRRLLDRQDPGYRE